MQREDHAVCVSGIDCYPRVDVFTASEERLLDLAIAFSGLP